MDPFCTGALVGLPA
jgi:C2 domain